MAERLIRASLVAALGGVIVGLGLQWTASTPLYGIGFVLFFGGPILAVLLSVLSLNAGPKKTWFAVASLLIAVLAVAFTLVVLRRSDFGR